MKEPIHHWKEHVTYSEGFNGKPPHWTFDGRPCWLGSGLYDRNGIEIYEGDFIKFGDEPEIYTVIFDDAVFWLGDNEYFLYHFESSELEVVGHIAEECEQ